MSIPSGAPRSELADAIIASAQRLGINPTDLATAISYETGGTFDPWKAGPTTKWGQHRGLIQWGEPQRQKYGVRQGMPVADQLRAAESYLKDAGVKPGMGLLDVYSAINAGRVGLYNRSDAHNGGAPGTVADKVASMHSHRLRADALLGGKLTDFSGPSTQTAQAKAPASGANPAQPPQMAPQGQPMPAMPNALQPMSLASLIPIVMAQQEQPAPQPGGLLEAPPPPPKQNLSALAALLQDAPPSVRGLLLQG